MKLYKLILLSSIFLNFFIAGCKTIENFSVGLYHPSNPLPFEWEKISRGSLKSDVDVYSELSSQVGRGLFRDYQLSEIYNEPIYLEKSPQEIISERFDQYATEEPSNVRFISSCKVTKFKCDYELGNSAFSSNASVYLSIKLKDGTEFNVFSNVKQDSGPFTLNPKNTISKLVTQTIEKSVTDCFNQISKKLQR